MSTQLSWPHPFVALALVTAMATFPGCAATPTIDAPLGLSPLGSVFLERIPDRSFHAAHPIILDATTLRTTLESILVETRVSMSAPIAEKQRPLRLFADAEVAFLAPLLSNGLRQAAQDQQISFTLTHQKNLFSHQDTAGAGVGSLMEIIPKPLV